MLPFCQGHLKVEINSFLWRTVVRPSMVATWPNTQLEAAAISQLIESIGRQVRVKSENTKFSNILYILWFCVISRGLLSSWSKQLGLQVVHQNGSFHWSARFIKLLIWKFCPVSGFTVYERSRRCWECREKMWYIMLEMVDIARLIHHQSSSGLHFPCNFILFGFHIFQYFSLLSIITDAGCR